MRNATNYTWHARVRHRKIREEAHPFYNTELTWRYAYLIFHWWYVNVLHFEVRDRRPADGSVDIPRDRFSVCSLLIVFVWTATKF